MNDNGEHGSSSGPILGIILTVIALAILLMA